MSTIVTRAGKGSPLTHTEVDNNFTNLNTDKYQSGNNASFGTLSATGATTFSGTTVISGSLTANTLSSSGATITGGTINSTAIGGTTAAAGKFTTLEATGVSTFAAGTVSAPAITTSGDTNTGIFFPAADTIAFAEGGAEALRIDSSGTVGIGNTTSSSFNSFANRLVVGSGSGDQGITIYAATTGRSSISFADGTSGAASYQGYIQYNHSDDSMLFYVNYAGDTNPRMFINSNGRVGINTTSPTTNLTIDTKASNYTDGINLVNSTNWGYGTSINFIVPPSSGASVATVCRIQQGYEAADKYNLLFFTYDSGLSERMRITSGGSLLVGTTTNRGVGTFFASSGNAIGVEHSGSGTVTAIEFRQGGPSLVCGSITMTSAVSTAYNTSSDYRLKENIAPMVGALDKVQALKPVTYTWKLNGFASQGFIAHELQAVVPDAVTGEKDAVDAESNPVYQGVDYGKITPLLTAALQEALTKIESLEARLAVLESK